MSWSCWPDTASPQQFCVGESTLWCWYWMTDFTASSTVVACALPDCCSYTTLLLKFNSWTDLLTFAGEPESLRPTEGRIDFKMKAALQVVGKATYLTNSGTSSPAKEDSRPLPLGMEQLSVNEYQSNICDNWALYLLSKRSWEWSLCPHTRIFQTNENSMQGLIQPHERVDDGAVFWNSYCLKSGTKYV